MRLHRISLKNYRGVADCAVEFSIQGITVVEGDNEVGKTCIPEAVNLIFTVLDDSGKQTVKAVRPVHIDADPEVEVAITSGEYRFTYFKRWHRSRGETTLEITAPQREQLTGREAHERVDAILNETLDRALWKALTIEQGAELKLPGFSGTSLGRALDQAASGGSEASDQEDDLWERICEEQDRYWTSTGRVAQERKSLSEEVDEAQRVIADLEEKLSAIEDDSEAVVRLASEEEQLVTRRENLSHDEGVFSEQWAKVEKLQTQVDRCKAAQQAADIERDRAAEACQRRIELIEALEKQSLKLHGLEDAAERIAPSLAAAEKRSEEARAAHSAARHSLQAAEDEMRRAEGDRDHHQKLIDKELLSERLERVMAAQEDLKTAEAVLAFSQVDGELVELIDQANANVSRAEAALSASAASVETSALAPVSVVIDGEEVELRPDDPQQSEVTDRWEIIVPDKVRLKVVAGTGSRNLVDEFEAAQREHDRLCTRGGVGSLADARRKAEERHDAKRQRDRAIETIKQDLRDLTPEVLAQKVDGLTRGIASYPADRPQSRPLPDSLEDARRIALDARTAFGEQQAEVRRCEENERGADETRQQARTDAAVSTSQIEDARVALQEADDRLAEARKGCSDAQLDDTLATEHGRLEEAATALSNVEDELAIQDPDSLEAKLNNARDVRIRAETDLRNNQDRQIELRSRLEAHGEAGLHSELNNAISKHEHLLREHERTEARAEAARLLFEAFEKRRQEAHQRYVAPFKEQIEKLGRIVFGPTFEVDLDANLRVARRTLEGITLDVDRLSTGAQEQLGVICRLACAAIVSPDGGGAPVVIDDALGWSDPSRLQTIGAAIAAAGRKCQVIVLTCTPGRYAHIGNATVVRLPI